MSNEFEPITTQEQFDQAIKARIERAQAKAAERFADYDELKAKAEEYDRAREASKTELQRAQDKAAKAEAELRELKDAQERLEGRLCGRVEPRRARRAALAHGG